MTLADIVAESAIQGLGEILAAPPTCGSTECGGVHHPAVRPDFLRAVAGEARGGAAQGGNGIDQKRHGFYDGDRDWQGHAFAAGGAGSRIDQLPVGDRAMG